MIAKSMEKFTANSSAVRAMFEEGARLAKEFGPENVYDFSLGNPNVPVPARFNQAVIDILANDDPVKVHGYMNNAGHEDVRATVAAHLNKLHGTAFTEKNIIMTVGAAGGLNVAFKTLLDPEEEVIAFAPYFVEYGAYVNNYNGILKMVPADLASFQINFDEFEKVIGPKTRVVIINSPHNPTGVVYSEETIKKVAALLEKKQQEYGSEIFIVADEPYRELVYGDVVVPYITKYYNNTIVAYSWSKSLSLPGERIGYLVLPTEMNDFEETVGAATIANRVLGFVNAPSLLQKAVARCIDESADIDFYERNGKTLYEGLTEYGYHCVQPQGAFYLWVKSPLEDEKEFCKLAKKYRILLVPGSSFACPGYVRIAYCVAYETVVNSLPGFKKLMEEIA